MLYEQLLEPGQPVDVAVARAVATGGAAAAPGGVAGDAGGVRRAGGGAAAAASARRRRTSTRPGADGVLPAEPARFVGRAAAMAQASAALAPGSGRTGVLLHGMAGAGKTACALELAYRHQDGFAAAAFWQAPTREEEWSTARWRPGRRAGDPAGPLRLHDDRAHRHGARAGGVPAPAAAGCWTEQGVLLVLDNLETLLTPEGTWRDPRWDPLIAALTGHDGESRVIMTSRIVPARAGRAGCWCCRCTRCRWPRRCAGPGAAEPARPAARRCRPGPGRRSAATWRQDRDRVRRVLHVVQGHPKLMELADAAAADRDRLDAQLAAAEAGRGRAGPGRVLPRRRQHAGPGPVPGRADRLDGERAGRAAAGGAADGGVRRLPGGTTGSRA